MSKEEIVPYTQEDFAKGVVPEGLLEVPELKLSFFSKGGFLYLPSNLASVVTLETAEFPLLVVDKKIFMRAAEMLKDFEPDIQNDIKTLADRWNLKL